MPFRGRKSQRNSGTLKNRTNCIEVEQEVIWGLIVDVSKDRQKISGCVSEKQIRFGIWGPGCLGDALSGGYGELEHV